MNCIPWNEQNFIIALDDKKLSDVINRVGSKKQDYMRVTISAFVLRLNVLRLLDKNLAVQVWLS